jgi:hypothetical protein
MGPRPAANPALGSGVGIRSWLEKRRERADEAAREHAADEAFDTPEERAIADSTRGGLAADEWGARRAGEGSPTDVNRLGDF